KYKMPTVRLEPSAIELLSKYRWAGNVRQLRNVAEQISVLEKDRQINATTLQGYLPDFKNNLPALINHSKSDSDFSSEREILYKVLFDMQRDINDLKSLTLELLKSEDKSTFEEENSTLIKQIYENFDNDSKASSEVEQNVEVLGISSGDNETDNTYDYAEEIQEEKSLSLQDNELELIQRALDKHAGKRKAAAEELGISERTLYRKIKQYNL